VAYNSLLVERRKALHRLIGLAIEELYADRLAEHYEVLAHHFSRGEEWAKALDYLLKAAEKAAKAYANREAVALYDQALEAAGQLGAAVGARAMMAIHRARSDIYFVLSEFERARTEGEQFLALARLAGDRASEAAALAGMGSASARAHDYDRALAYARQAIQIAEQLDDKSILASGHFTIAQVYAVTGRIDQAWEEVDQTLTKE
jgi:predicted ATPase